VETVKIVCLIDAKVTITGTVTGNVYVFAKAGTVLDIDIRDKDELLSKKKRACCSGNQSNPFQLA
jgi:hypothetical protein